ncbi:DUF3179 domain-containing protein [Jannaschia ovalis]|uniref:DUF3179 domain-containing protein n=1 Tax=Jannaschia ovalis TaxID=3038773 RepID=A0ABY8LAH2_9RHOB|nr:DUF3179 domain-containing protein [Jannaschia sp. GRR-S6-38]WGH78289.1 DUF3179 domain-containing protein [Jannaschia sp. GRR-S6-38]
MIRLLLAALLLIAPPVAADPAFWRHEFPLTDFTTSSVPFIEIISGGPGRDGIPALDAPEFIAVSEAALDPAEPVIALEIDGAAPRAYPIRYLTWHEIVNDMVGGVPVAVTFCPLCNSAITFDRRVDGAVLSFGVTGKLRRSDMVMYDRETESWWQQAVGEGIVGRHTGTRLGQLASWMEPFAAFRERNPRGRVMAEPDLPRDYGRNPYRGYDRSDWPFLYRGDAPPHGIDPMARIVRVGTRAWPMARLAQAGRITEAGVTLDWRSGMASPLDTGRIAEGRDIGHIRVRDGQGRDVPHDLMFAFAFHAFHPDGEWMLD